jgi:hypothetical protein
MERYIPDIDHQLALIDAHEMFEATMLQAPGTAEESDFYEEDDFVEWPGVTGDWICPEPEPLDTQAMTKVIPFKDVDQEIHPWVREPEMGCLSRFLYLDINHYEGDQIDITHPSMESVRLEPAEKYDSFFYSVIPGGIPMEGVYVDTTELERFMIDVMDDYTPRRCDPTTKKYLEVEKDCETFVEDNPEIDHVKVIRQQINRIEKNLTAKPRLHYPPHHPRSTLHILRDLERLSRVYFEYLPAWLSDCYQKIPFKEKYHMIDVVKKRKRQFPGESGLDWLRRIIRSKSHDCKEEHGVWTGLPLQVVEKCKTKS